MPITRDDKDWTWVLERPCPQCGFEPGSFGFREVADLARANLAAWPAELERAGSPDRRPDDSTWSLLEYAAHVRDVGRIMHARLNLMLVLNDPDFANWDQDETASEQDYRHQSPARVARELTRAGRAIADAFEDVPDSALARTGRRSNGSVFTVETLAKYFLHDIVHHRWDVSGVRFAAPAAPAGPGAAISADAGDAGAAAV